MLDRHRKLLTNVFRAIVGILIGVTGVSFQASGREAWALIFYLSGFAIGIPGATYILIRLAFTASYLAVLLVVYWLIAGNSEFTLFDAFRSWGPGWWQYFWWVPVSVVIVVLVFSIMLYKSIDEGPDDRNSR